MISDEKLIKAADAFVKAHAGDDDLDPDLAAVMGTYQAQRDQDGHDLGAQVHARALLRRATSLGYDKPKPAAKKSTAKKSTAKKTAKKS